MDAVEAVQMIAQRAMNAYGLSDLEIGTVTKVNPLQVKTQDVQDPIPAEALILTANVVEKKIPVLKHNHVIRDSYTGGGSSETALNSIACYENGKALPVENGYIILNRALRAGDQVIMMAVSRGQRHIILSRSYGGET